MFSGIDEMIAPAKHDTHGKASAAKRPSSKRRLRWHLLLAALGALALVLYFALCIFERRKAETPKNESAKKPRIASSSSVAKKIEVETAQEPVKQKWSKDTDRVHRDENKRVVHDPDAPLGSKANPINIDAMTFPDNPIQPKRKLFETHAENYICGLMRTKPGTRIIPTRLPANFDEEFKAHIADPVRIEDGDSEEDIALKEQMHEFKKEAARLIGEGMTPTEIILQERKELNRIADHRAVCAAEIGRLKREGASEQEIEDCINAANSIMEQYGARKFMTTAQIKQMLFEKNQK